MSDMLEMAERLAEKRELERLREENTRLEGKLAEARSKLSRYDREFLRYLRMQEQKSVALAWAGQKAAIEMQRYGSSGGSLVDLLG